MQKLILLSLSIIVLLSLSSCKQNGKNTSDKTDNLKKELTVQELSEEDIVHYTKMGKDIAQATFKSMSGNLKKAMKEGGVSRALKYCNTAAGPLADSLSLARNATIKRTSLKLRNVENKASQDEFGILINYNANIRDSIALKPIINTFGEDKVKFYAPIMLKEICLSCHGQVNNRLTPENYAIIKELYPEDKAIDYKEGDYRGIWSIEMDRK